MHPRYWLTWLMLIFWALLAQLPFRWQMKLGRGFGRLLLKVAKRRRHIAERNLSLCYPELTEAERLDLLKKNFESSGIAFFETAIAWFKPYRFLENRFEIIGREHWQGLENDGLLIIGMHFLTMEMANAHLNRHYSYHMMYRPHRNKVYDYVQMKCRERHNADTEVIPREDLRKTIKYLKNKHWVWYAPDQDYGRKLSEFVPWFGINCATVKATPKIVGISGAKVAFLAYYRKPDDSGYELVLHPVMENFPTDNPHEDLKRLNDQIESCVRRCPEQYMWLHRRFKTRPEGESSVY